MYLTFFQYIVATYYSYNVWIRNDFIEAIIHSIGLSMSMDNLFTDRRHIILSYIELHTKCASKAKSIVIVTYGGMRRNTIVGDVL